MHREPDVRREAIRERLLPPFLALGNLPSLFACGGLPGRVVLFHPRLCAWIDRRAPPARGRYGRNGGGLN